MTNEIEQLRRIFEDAMTERLREERVRRDGSFSERRVIEGAWDDIERAMRRAGITVTRLWATEGRDD